MPKVFDHSGSGQSVMNDQYDGFPSASFSCPEEEWLHCLCSVRSLQMYVQKNQGTLQKQSAFCLVGRLLRELSNTPKVVHWLIIIGTPLQSCVGALEYFLMEGLGDKKAEKPVLEIFYVVLLILSPTKKREHF